MVAACYSLSNDLYSNKLHFVSELVQNADDNTYSAGERPTLVFELVHGGHLLVKCNEVGFNEENVRALCDIGKSTKNDISRFIGRFCIHRIWFVLNASCRRERHRLVFRRAVRRRSLRRIPGFKSVFTVANVVHISSGPYTFKFDKSHDLGMLTPIWESHQTRMQAG